MNPWQFDVVRVSESDVRQVMDQTGFPHFIAATLAGRGIGSASDLDAFLNPQIDRDWLSPYLIPGMEEVATALYEEIKQESHILVFGDFDVDGITSTTVLTRALREMGAHVDPFIPRRVEEGYGLSVKALDRIEQLVVTGELSCKPDVIISVDCGISCNEAVNEALHRGYRVLITDHHEPGDQVPVAVPVADPKLDSQCPSAILAGVGVALKLVQAVGCLLGRPHLWRDYTDFAALGTVADLMPLLRENRSLVTDGVYQMNAKPRPCIHELLKRANVEDGQVSSTGLSFSVIPRLNAAGRIEDCRAALDLLLEDDFAECQRLAEHLSDINDTRKKIQKELEKLALDQAFEKAERLKAEGRRLTAMLVWGEGWHEGVKGVVASRLVNEFGVPCLLFTICQNDEGAWEARGSGRSVGKVNLFKAVESLQDLLTRFGGHDAAVGITLPLENLEEFERRFCAYMEQFPEEDFRPLMHIDAYVSLDELTIENVETLRKLEPFGQGNTVPRYMAQNVLLSNCRKVGKDQNHLSCKLGDGRVNANPDVRGANSDGIAAIKFRCEDIDDIAASTSVMNVAFSLQIDEWKGRKSVKAMVEAFAPSKSCAALEACISEDDAMFMSDLYEENRDVRDELSETRVSDAQLEVQALARNREMWELQARQQPEELQQAIIHALIGDHALHPAQESALESLSQGKSVLSIMATGRGKSLVFQVHAATRALQRRQASIFVYPLRALMADQAFHLNDALKVFGIVSEVLNGDTSTEERARIFAGLQDGSVDIALTTPEFLECHMDDFVACRRIGFLVVDEAHHVGQINTGQRSAYAALPEAIARCQYPVVLACTATADDAVSKQIRELLSIDEVISDVASRDNLTVIDYRDNRNRNDYLANLIAKGQKTIVYVNSREQSDHLARMLRDMVPQMALLIGFYNADMRREERNRIETMFRSGALQVLVATSAFGEGVNIPDIRHVVLYHVPFNGIELNQISGRAGRDGLPATIHLLFNREDANANERILRTLTPDVDTMRDVYRYFKELQRNAGPDFFTLSDDDLLHVAEESQRAQLSSHAVKCGIAVFSDLGLIETQSFYADGKTSYLLRIREGAGRVELQQSVRYREGSSEIENFEMFRKWVMGCKVDHVQAQVCTPIYPQLYDRLFGGDSTL